MRQPFLAYLPETVLFKPNNPQLGIGLMLASVLCLAAMEAVAKILTATYPFQMVAWGRYAFHVLLILPFLITATGRSRLVTRRIGLHLIRTLILVAATLCFIAAITVMPLADATALVFTAPLVVTGISALFLGERVGIRRWLAVLVGFAGVLVIVRPGPDFTNWIALLPLAAGVLYAFYQVSTRMLAATDHAMTLFFYTAIGGMALMSAIVPFYWVTPTGPDLALMALMGVFGCAGQYLLIKSLETANASVVAPFVYAQLIWATLFGLVLFAQFPDLWTLVGAAVLVASGLYIWNRERRLARAGQPPGT